MASILGVSPSARCCGSSPAARCSIASRFNRRSISAPSTPSTCSTRRRFRRRSKDPSTVRVLRFLAVLALAAGLHLVAVRLFPDFPLYVDLFLVVAVFHARDGHSVAGMLGGAAAGL